MIYLLLSIISSTSIFVIFKFVDKYKVSTFDVIIINYLIASTLGYLISDYSNVDILPLHENGWLPYAFIIGILFIIMFVIVGKSSQKVGIAITTVASKMSVITPILFSILYDPTDHLTIKKSIGISIALLAVFLTIYRKRKIDFDPQHLYLPILLFLGMGIVDSVIKFSQHNYVSDALSPLFTAILFTIAAITGLTTNLIRKNSFKNLRNKGVLFWGILLGISNYGSIYFLIRALNHKTEIGIPLDGSIVFGMNNLGIVGLSVLIGLFFFREKLTRLNWIGILLSFVAIYILSQY